MLRASEALKIIVESIQEVSEEECSLSDALGRVIAEDIVAPCDVPPFDNSSMDGYALRSEDTGTSEKVASLRLAGEVPAGAREQRTLPKGTAIHIMTGAPIPEGADAVIEQELVTGTNGSVSMNGPVRAGRNIRRRGEDVKEGTTVLQRGVALNPAHIGVLASLAFSRIRVHRKPRVAIMTTGNEIVEAGEELAPGQIHDSNSYSLAAAVKGCGCDPVNIGAVKDVSSSLRNAAAKGLEHDALITSGGVSVGKYDLALPVLRDLGVQIKFWKVNIKPGMPMAFGVASARAGSSVPVFALPGNPVSTMVTFLQFVRPGLLRLMGVRQQTPGLRFKARLEEPVKKTDGKLHFVRGVVRNHGDEFIVRTTGSQSSGVLTSVANANCLIIIPEDASDLAAGQLVEIELL